MSGIELVDETREMKKTTDAATCKIQALVVDSQDSYEQAVSMAQDIKAHQKKIEEHHAPLKKTARAAHQAVINAEKELLEPLAQLKGLLTNKMTTYSDEQDRKAEAAAREAENKARAEHQRKLTAAANYAKKIVAACGELDEQIDAINVELEKDISDENAQALRSQLSILEAQKRGKAQAAAERERQAEEALQKATYTPPPTVTETPKAKGAAVIKKRVGEVVDMKALIKGIASGDIMCDPGELFKVQVAGLNALIKMGVFPAGETTHGVKVVIETDTRIRARK